MADRRRLTVSKCDPVKPRSPRSQDKGESELGKLIDSLKVEFEGKTVVSLNSKTDRDLSRRGSFAGKDTESFGSLPGANDGADYIVNAGIGYVCNKGMKPESPNQDSFSIVVVEGVFALYGVYDGHGPMGHFVSDIAREKLVTLFLSDPSRNTPSFDAGELFKTVFVNTQKYIESDEVTKARKVDPSSSGSTCTMAYHDMVQGIVTVAHVGDSRSIIASKVGGKYTYIEDLTIDHKPNLPEEKKRIESSNPPGRVVFDGYYNHRVFAQGGMYPGLNMSRALGDVVAHKEAGLTAMPDIKVVQLKDHTKIDALILFLCSDGVWEFLESPDAVTETFHEKHKGNLMTGVKSLAKKSYDSWMADSDNEISDDITAVVITIPTAKA